MRSANASRAEGAHKNRYINSKYNYYNKYIIKCNIKKNSEIQLLKSLREKKMDKNKCPFLLYENLFVEKVGLLLTCSQPCFLRMS